MSGRWASAVRSLGLALAGCACIACAAPLGARFAAARVAEYDGAELTLFPSGRFLHEASLGHPQLAADLAWLTAIQYYGRHRLEDRRYPHAAHLFHTVTEVDPDFENAYFFGSLVLAEAGEREEAERLLRRGCERNPEAWRLRFELGFFHYVVTRSYDEAAADFAVAATLPGAHESARRFAAAASQRAGDLTTARELWRLLGEESSNEEIRRMAHERLETLAQPEGGSGQRAPERTAAVEVR